MTMVAANTFSDALLLAQVRMHRPALLVSIAGAAVVAVLLMFKLSAAMDLSRALVWGVALVVAQGYGLWLVAQSKVESAADALNWRRRYRLHFAMHGFAWLLGGLMLEPMAGSADYYLLIVVLTAMAAGAMISAGFDPLASGLFAGQASLPMMVHAFMRGNESTITLGLILVVFILYSVVTSIRAAMVLKDAEWARWQAAKHADELRESNAQIAQSDRELARIESVVRANDQRFRDFTDNASDWFWETDADARFTYFSDNYEKIFGVPPDTVLGKSRFDILANDVLNQPEHIAAHAAALRRHERFSEFEYRFRAADTEPRWISISGAPFYDDSGQFGGYRGTGHLINARKQVEEQLAQALQNAEAASRAKSEFLASMSHELRTPLNAILGFSQLFVSDEQLSQDNRELAGEIYHAGQHLLGLVGDLIDLARIESGKLDLSVETIVVGDVIAESIALVMPLATGRNIALTSKHSGGDTAPNLNVRGDYLRTRQVLINFLSNAIKYNRPGGRVEVTVADDGDLIRLAVSDNGPGIPAEKQARLFSAFDRLGAEGGTVEGTGIGLVISKRIVEAMGGELGFESTEGQGSQFWFALPRADIDATADLRENAPERNSVMNDQQHSSNRPIVLYVEDNPMNLKLMQHIFARRPDLQLRDAPTAEIGLDLAVSLKPALILLDINLPGMSGYDAIELLKQRPETQAIPIVALTANAMKGDAERGRQAGFDDYLTKPIDIEKLMRMLDKLLDSKKAQ